MAGVEFPSSFNVTGRFPLDAKYWVNTYADLNIGEISVGLHRWTLDTGKEYYLSKNNIWKLLPTESTSPIGIYRSGLPSNGMGPIIWSLGPDSPLDYQRYRYVLDSDPDFFETFTQTSVDSTNRLLTAPVIPTDTKSIQLWIVDELGLNPQPVTSTLFSGTSDEIGSQVVDSLEGTQTDKAPSVRAVNEYFSEVYQYIETKADVDSPTFTGEPEAPYPALNPTNLTGIATQGYVIDRLGKCAAVEINGVMRVFATYGEAEQQVQTSLGTDIYIYGYHTLILVTKNITLKGPGIVLDLIIGFNSNIALNVGIYDIAVARRLAVCSCTTANRAFNVIIDSIQTGPNTYLEHYSIGSTGTVTDQVLVRNTDINTSFTHSATGGSNCVFFQERDFSPANNASYWKLENCRLYTTTSNVFGGYAHPNTRIELAEQTVVKSGFGKSLTMLRFIGSSTPIQESAVLIDNRSYPFKHINQNQVGTHPAFDDQHTLNLYLLGNGGSTPAETVTITNVVAS